MCCLLTPFLHCLISQLKSEIRLYRCNNFSLKQVSGLLGRGGGVRKLGNYVILNTMCFIEVLLLF